MLNNQPSGAGGEQLDMHLCGGHILPRLISSGQRDVPEWGAFEETRKQLAIRYMAFPPHRYNGQRNLKSIENSKM